MAGITNNHRGAIELGGVLIQPGKTAEVKSYDAIKTTGAIPVWLKNGIISVSANEDDASDAPDDKDTLIAQIKAAGGDANKRMGVDTLTAKLAELTQGAGSEEE